MQPGEPVPESNRVKSALALVAARKWFITAHGGVIPEAFPTEEVMQKLACLEISEMSRARDHPDLRRRPGPNPEKELGICQEGVSKVRGRIVRPQKRGDGQ